ncbi:hypothetical protein TRFO_35588 [Tritrichomonas foetus]|uniref:Uncharacterized protein n=1 Tax=Tritrichomonas foetus TaxID=1144522 RepID=A0A1J4JFX7_9EUKA|nr:hypothetical protein TRFO_35588 [Tritrichomonas foetus]|eukprot:OHS98058.1 hypothetical protein TRFO_35588 [Tritrichomonas foetus]
MRLNFSEKKWYDFTSMTAGVLPKRPFRTITVIDGNGEIVMIYDLKEKRKLLYKFDQKKRDCNKIHAEYGIHETFNGIIRTPPCAQLTNGCLCDHIISDQRFPFISQNEGPPPSNHLFGPVQKQEESMLSLSMESQRQCEQKLNNDCPNFMVNQRNERNALINDEIINQQLFIANEKDIIDDNLLERIKSESLNSSVNYCEETNNSCEMDCCSIFDDSISVDCHGANKVSHKMNTSIKREHNQKEDFLDNIISHDFGKLLTLEVYQEVIAVICDSAKCDQ